MMQPGPPWPTEGSAVPGEAGGRASEPLCAPSSFGGPWEAGPRTSAPAWSPPSGTGSGPAPCLESLLRPPAPCLGPELALSAAPERAGCASQVRAAASALRPRHRPAGRAGSSWLGEDEGRGSRWKPKGRATMHPLCKFAESF